MKIQNPNGSQRALQVQRIAGFVAAIFCFASFCAHGFIPTNYPTGTGPMNVVVGADGKLIYQPDTNGDTIPDISNCGYMGGGVPIPTNLPVVLTLNAISGDNLTQIQNAITTVGNLPIQANGFRGAILLKAGLYPVSNKITLTKSGVILRGEGAGPNGTVLQMTGGNITILNMDNGGSGASEVSNTRHNITDPYVPVGAKWFHVDSTNGWKVGDTVKVVRVGTPQWLAIINQTNWSASAFFVKWDRIITDMNSNQIALDAPITQGIDTNYGGGYVYKYSFTGRLTNCAFEDIRGICSTGVDTNGNTDGNFLTLNNVMNCWVRRCTNDKMRGHTSDVTGDSKWITFEDIVSYHTYIPNHSGSSIQINTYNGLTLGLFHRVTTSDGGFEFSSGGLTPGPNAIVECDIPHGFAATSPHMKWAVATVYDALYMNQALSVQDQGLNSSHGWAGANQIAWNVETASSFNFDRPQTAHQMIIGGIGNFGGNRTGTLPPEIISKNAHVMPRSLYRQQLSERVGSAATLAVLGAPYGDNYFVLNASTNSADVSPGLSVSNTLTMTVKATTPYTNLNMYTANFYTNYPRTNVTFSVSGLPPGATATFNPPTLNTNGSTIMTITTTAATPGGTYPLVLKGVGMFKTLAGGISMLTNYDTMTLNVANLANFSVAATPQSQTVIAAGSTDFSVTLTPTNGFFGTVILAVSGLPANTSASFNPPSLNETGISTLTVNTSNNTPVGAYTVTVTGTSGGAAAATSVDFSVAPAPGTLPPPWTDSDLGTPAISGEGTYSNGTFIVQGAGVDIGGAADEGHFVFQPFPHDLVFSARVLNEQNTSPSAQAGIMVRETTDADSAFVAVLATPADGVLMEFRPLAGSSAVVTPGPVLTVPCWVKLTRSGDVFSGYGSKDGTNWSLIASTNIPMTDPVSAGLAVCSENGALLNTSIFDNVTLLGPDFLLIATTSSQTVNAGLDGSFNISIIPTNGFVGMVQLVEDDDLTADAGAALSTNLVTVPGWVQLNFSTATTTPQDSYTLNITASSGRITHDATFTLNVASLLLAGLWTGASGEDISWSDGQNWGNGLPAAASDNVKFYDFGAITVVGASSSVVDADAQIASVQFGNTNGFHTLQIAPGTTLTVSGSTGANGYAFFVGTASDNGSNQTLTATISGEGGGLVVSNTLGSWNMGQGSSTALTQKATLDMSDLDNFSATLNNFYLGNQPANNANNPGHQTATLYLAKTNLIALGAPGSLLISQAASDGTTTGNNLYLGQSNAVQANTVITSGGKGGVGNSIAFNPALSEGNATFRGSLGGTNRVSLWAVGYATSSSANNDSIGTNDFTGGTIDALVDTMILGRGQGANNAGRGGSGTFTFNSGVLDVNTLELGFQQPANSSYGTGVMTVNGTGKLVVNNVIGLGSVGANPNANTRGTLSINGGIVWANAITNGGSASSAVMMNGGTLGVTNFMGTPAGPIPIVATTNGTWHFQLNGAAPSTNLVAGNLTTIGVNSIVIDSIQNVSGPATFPLAAYGSLNGSVAANISVGKFPPGFTGTLVDNAVQNRIDLTINPAPIAPPLIGIVSISGDGIVFGGSKGPWNRTYYVLASTNLSLPFSNWSRIATNTFDESGNFNFSNGIGADRQYYLLQVP